MMNTIANGALANRTWVDWQSRPEILEASPIKPRKLTQKTGSTYKAGNILVVGDLNKSKNLLGFLLRKWGYRFEVVSNLSSANQRLGRSSFDLVFFDLEHFGDSALTTASSMLVFLRKLKSRTNVIGMLFDPSENEKAFWNSIGIKAVLDKGNLNGLSDAIKAVVHANQSWKFRPHDAELEFTSECMLDTKEIAFARLQCGAQTYTTAFQYLKGTIHPKLSALQKAITAQDREEVQEIAEFISRSFSSLGLNSISLVALQLIKQTKKQNWSNLSTVIRILEAQCKKSIVHLQNIDDFAFPSI